MRAVVPFVFAFCPLWVPVEVKADLPPPKDYVERCVLEKQQGPGEHCEVCGTSFQGREGCLKPGEQGCSLPRVFPDFAALRPGYRVLR